MKDLFGTVLVAVGAWLLCWKGLVKTVMAFCDIVEYGMCLECSIQTLLVRMVAFMAFGLALYVAGILLLNDYDK